jgi:peptidyl-prolyl cis-trans isomerase C
MTALVLNGRPLNFRAKSNLNSARGFLRRSMGPLEHERLRVVLAQAEQAGIRGSIPDALRDPRLVQILSRQFTVPTPSHDACLRFYRDHLERFREPDRYVGRQIVLLCPWGEAAQRREVWARAERLIAILFFDPKMFGDLVATYDSISDGSGSGRIGPVARGQLPAELDAAFFGLKPGEIYPTPVATERGIHVMMLDRILPGEITAFAAVQGRISAELRSEMRTAAARRHLARLAERYKVAAAVD